MTVTSVQSSRQSRVDVIKTAQGDSPDAPACSRLAHLPWSVFGPCTTLSDRPSISTGRRPYRSASSWLMCTARQGSEASMTAFATPSSAVAVFHDVPLHLVNDSR